MARITAFIGVLAFAIGLISAPAPASAGVFIGIGVSVNIAPPPLPVYVQPPVLVPDEIWTPGYWAYGDNGYYWVPGTWVPAPQPGYLWTPGYWGYNESAYVWHPGYWGPHIGFYGGVNYGFGYLGVGYVGGGWYGDHFRYNTAITNVNRTVINNVYVNRTVINNTYYNNTTVNRVSYNGGPEGIQARPSAQEVAYRDEPHLPPTSIQREHIQTAALNRGYLASVNHGRPDGAAFAQPLSRENRPENFAPVTPEDRQADTYRAPAASYHAPEGAYHAPTDTYREPAYHAPVQHAPAYHAPAYHAPAYHAPRAPAERAPAEHREHT